MSATGTRPPLFDPEPGSFDDDVDPPRFPHRPSGRRGGGVRPDDASPRWVRPFLLGGLVLVALLSLLSFLGGGHAEDPSTPAVPATAPAVAQEPPPTPEPAPPPAATPAPAEAVASAPLVPADDVARPGPTADDADLLVARAFAAQFAHDYLNLDEANPQVRQRNLRAYLAPGLDPQLGWDGTGTQVAVLTVPVDATRTDRGVTITVAAQVTGRDAPRWVHLAVPLGQDDVGRWAVIAAPGYVPRPEPGAPAPADGPALDEALGSALQPAAQALFTAFATDEVVRLDGVTSPGSTIRGLDGQVELVGVGPLQVHRGAGPARTAEVEVTWRDEVTRTTLAQRYTLDLLEDDGAWLVHAVTNS
jgi:hypothetical protein